MFVVLLPVPVFLMQADVRDQMRGIHAWRHWSVGENTGRLIQISHEQICSYRMKYITSCCFHGQLIDVIIPNNG